MRWQDRVSSEEVAKRLGLKEIQKSETQEKIAMVRTCEKRDRRQRVLRRIEEMEVPVRRQVGRPRRTWRGTVHQDLEVIEIEEGSALLSTMEEDHHKFDPKNGRRWTINKADFICFC